jgi:hypothetical protein
MAENTAAPGFSRFMAMAVSRARIFMVSRLRRMALPGPGSVFAVPCAFDAPSVSGVDRALRLAPVRALAAGAQDRGVVRHDADAPRRRAVWPASRLEGTARAVASVGAVPSPARRAVARGESLPGWAADDIAMRVVFEAFGRKAPRALAAGRAHGRDHGFDSAILEGGRDPARPMRGIGRDPAGSGAAGLLDGVGTVLEPGPCHALRR